MKTGRRGQGAEKTRRQNQQGLTDEIGVGRKDKGKVRDKCWSPAPVDPG